MIPLPEKGEALKAAEAMNARMLAAVPEAEPGVTFTAGDVRVNSASGEMQGEGIGVLGVYGDLFDVGEVVQVSTNVAEQFMFDLATGKRSPLSAMVSLYLLGVGVGVVMERERWTRKAGVQ